jgi:hypothetical protein
MKNFGEVSSSFEKCAKMLQSKQSSEGGEDVFSSEILIENDLDRKKNHSNLMSR